MGRRAPGGRRRKSREDVPEWASGQVGHSKNIPPSVHWVRQLPLRREQTPLAPESSPVNGAESVRAYAIALHRLAVCRNRCRQTMKERRARQPRYVHCHHGHSSSSAVLVAVVGFIERRERKCQHNRAHRRRYRSGEVSVSNVVCP